MQTSYSDREKHNYTERTPRRGTLDHELMMNRTSAENSAPESTDPNQERLTHEDRVNRYNEAVAKKNGHHGPQENGHRLDDAETDDDHNDDKSNVSELTEDRTQRAYDTKLQERQATVQYTMSDMTGENVIDGLPGKSQILPQSSGDGSDYPPRFILGAPAEDRPDDIISSKSMAESTTKGTKLSVAQRARLAAERNSNSVDINATAETMRLQEAKERQHVERPPPPKTRSQSPGMFSNLASMIKKTAETRSPSRNGSASVASNASTKQSKEVTLSLAERQQKQRERQLRILREQGLLRDGETIKSHSSQK